MPLPMPRWVISSPSHITSAVPAVQVMMIMQRLVRGEVRDEHPGPAELRVRLPSSPPLPLFNTNTNAVDCIERERDGEVARPLRDLLLPGLAFVLPFLELRDHDAEQLHDDRRRDVRHDPEEEHRDRRERAAREHVEQSERAARVLRPRPSACWIGLKSTYGTGMCDPSRKMKMMKIVKRILFRRSGTRNMFRRRESLTSLGPHGVDDLRQTGIGSVASGS